jgi:2-polyprenyl-3-methyl-5-hydroxy-6-metoxy-1,4-benzoquinol methylase
MIEHTNAQAFYDDYWRNRTTRLNSHEVARLGEILCALAMLGSEYLKREDLEICDLGCGSGWLSNELCKFGATTGVDLSESGVELARQRWPAVSEFHAADVTQWRPGRQFDLVVSSEVFEHIDDKRAFVDTVHTILKPGGYLLLTTPNRRLKRQWDAGQQGQQFIEIWVTPGELRTLFGRHFLAMHHATFLFDALYTGVFRYTSAPKLISLLDRIGLRKSYDLLRELLGIGLYQIYLGQHRAEVP